MRPARPSPRFLPISVHSPHFSQRLLLSLRRHPLLPPLLDLLPNLRLDILVGKVHLHRRFLGHWRGEGLLLDPAGLDPPLQLGALVGVAVRGVDRVRQ